ncbi:caspase domain-containing protein [Spirosoma soli]|uniref:Caspase domain-containing protein n=1 Tax=Spirosoma soli TaxID=1770529 RepID=A0ABW5M290_9BACT
MKPGILLLSGLLFAITALAQEPESAISTSRSVRQKIDTKGLYGIETVEAPQIIFLTGDGSMATVQTDQLLIKACVKTSKPLTRLSLFVNDALQQADRDLKVQADTEPACDHPLSQTVQLREGDNRLKLVAQNPGGTTSETFLVRYEKKAPVVAEKRLALVIGNASYPGASRLVNPVNDANDMAAALEKVGFEVMLHTNVTKQQMAAAINDFGEKLQDNCQVGMFYYAGHGMQHAGTNFLVPIDAEPRSAGDIEYTCEFADRVLAKMREAHVRTNIVVLDACRNNPFDRSWARGDDGNKGLSPMNGPSGSYLAFATAPGQTAADGTARNGLYTSALLKYLNVPDLSIESVFKQVRLEVMKQSNSKQTPWDSSSLTGDFYFLRK